VPIPKQSAPITVVPSAGLPPNVSVNKSNANLAIAHYRGRYFLVFRAAKWQIADNNVRLYVVSSLDQVHWRYEGMWRYGRALREPRFVVWRGHLFLYFALLGNNAAAFQPGGELVTRYRGVGKWTRPVKTMPQPDFIAWAYKTHHGHLYMTGYDGGGGTFTPNPPPKHVFCTAPAKALWEWTCRGDRRRLDSPYVFVDRGHAYVIARRQPNFGGYYDFLGINLPDTDPEFALYDGSYAATTKRCSLWSINLRTRNFEPLIDVPGTGDTCYPEVIPESGHRYLVYNYSSPFGTDPPWGTALTIGNTLIYRQTLTFQDQ
jgi:hypothetical protein